MNHLVLTVGRIGELTGLQFDPTCNHAGCGICGEVFQSPLDRLQSPTVGEWSKALELRTEWRIRHAGTHTAAQHRQLRLSGLFALPEAAQKLASYGIIPLTDTVRHDEVSHALLESPRAPSDDVEGS